MIEIEITETARNNLKDDPHVFNKAKHTFISKEDAIEFIIDRYGKYPKGRNKIYIDNKEGNTIELGFLHSFWNKDISHNSRSWYQTDWITFFDVNRIPITI